MGFLKKLKKVIKKIDPIGSKIHEATGGKLHSAVAKATNTGVLGKLSKLDPVMSAVRKSSMGQALREFPGNESRPLAAPPPMAPPAGVVPPQMPAGSGMAAPPMPAPMTPPMSGPGMGAPGPMGGVVPPGGPMGAPMGSARTPMAARGAALRGMGRMSRPGY
jgi:hypothetical protein